ncbi:hypothetical protein CYMTET_10809 [Cymbomonas tetramitiformis]|uniref:Peptidase M24 domain-containing protein n=1 Tax=Cymbomonas tetramitiformis TaxID=36881 RepID=A0AAE0BEK3_9CHLO|nr:hypothetical protein CYMTET_55151 [Cymbomonas tetramitiformis]KAK3281394.1 hypothetical protein CYMTET_10809 [Cymbomonas tetramitiformis]
MKSYANRVKVTSARCRGKKLHARDAPHVPDISNLDGVREACRICVLCMHAASDAIGTGYALDGSQVEELVAQVMLKNRAHSGSMCDTADFDACCCVSVNEVAAHAVPTSQRFAPGDVIKVDVVVHLQGYMGDMARTLFFDPPKIDTDIVRLYDINQRVVLKTILELNSRLSKSPHTLTYAEIGKVLKSSVDVCRAEHRDFRWTALEDLCGHRIGKKMHIRPWICMRDVASSSFETELVREHDTFCIEPVCCLGDVAHGTLNEQHEIVAADLSTHFEVTCGVKRSLEGSLQIVCLTFTDFDLSEFESVSECGMVSAE